MIDWSYDLDGAPRNKEVWLTIEFNSGEFEVVKVALDDFLCEFGKLIAWKPVETKPAPAKPLSKGKLNND